MTRFPFLSITADLTPTPAAHRRFMQLPVNDRLAVFSDILSFLECVVSRNYVAIDFYDGSIMYDFANGKTAVGNSVKHIHCGIYNKL